MHQAASDVYRLYGVLRRLYEEQAAAREDGYLVLHGQEHWLRHQVEVFAWYRRHLPAAGVFLDWGCRHGPDASLLRAALGPAVEIHGCDFPPPDDYRPFHQFAG